MYGIYGDLIGAAERALSDFGETGELLEYPEVQADKAYYLSVLSRYNELKLIYDKLGSLKYFLGEERAFSALLRDAKTDYDREAVYGEISSLKRQASHAASELSALLGCGGAVERAYCRLKLKKAASEIGVALYNLLREDLYARGAEIRDEKLVKAKEGYTDEISFYAEGRDVLSRFSMLSGAHRVYISGAKSEELCFAVSPAARIEKPAAGDLKIDVFHSHGAGGQNINKVETAVRVTHIPTGLSVVCQDERSQLKNKKRALEAIERRLKEGQEQSEKKRIEADISAQYSRKNTPISFDKTALTMTDTRLSGFTRIPFPLSEKDFTRYLNGLMAL